MSSLLDPRLPTLYARWGEGYRSTNQLHEGSGPATAAACASCAAHTARLCQASASPGRSSARAWKKVASWILPPLGSLVAADRAAVAKITGRSPELTATRAPVRDFAGILCRRRGGGMEGGVSTAESQSRAQNRRAWCGQR